MLTTDKTMLFCIGAQKAGTSWLYSWLSTHPECHMPVKEVHYFDAVIDPKRAEAVIKRRNATAERVKARAEKIKLRALARKSQKSPEQVTVINDHTALLERSTTNSGDDSDYLAFLLKDSDPKPVIGDITPSYATLSRNEFARMNQLSQNSRFLYLMRDPIDRLWSEIRMSGLKTAKRVTSGKGKGQVETSDELYTRRCFRQLDAAIAEGPLTGPHRSNYMSTLSELAAAVPEDKFMTMFFEDMFEQASVDKVCAFIGIAPVPAQVEAVRFPGRKLAFPQDRYAGAYKCLSSQYEGAAAKFGDALPARWRDRMKAGQANG